MSRGYVRCALRLCAVMVMIVASCSDGNESKSQGGFGIDDGASQGESKAVVVPAGRGATLTLTTGAEVELPEGALEREVKLALRRPADREAELLARSMSARHQLSSAPYVITPHRTSFTKPVSVTLPIARGNVERLVVAWLADEDDSEWKVIGKPRVTGARAVIEVEHFSVLALFEELDVNAEGDASADVATDAGGTGVGAGKDAAVTTSVLSARIRARLETCSLVERTGDFSFEDDGYQTFEETCTIECYLSAPCAELAAEFCGVEPLLPEFERCYAACSGHARRRTCFDDAGATIDAGVCDAYVECANGEDEIMCPEAAFFMCATGDKLLADDERCNGLIACPDGSDEAGCPESTRFLCANGEQIGSGGVCDGDLDCSDGADEANCAGQLFTCADRSRTIAMRSVCDLFPDCDDGSDEPSRCLKVLCGT